ncbi:ECF RNA polymerase sigma factor SigK [Nocardia wallacei]|uniref:ECF RNA polymerase sigma factor SigK n=1 Tax=Nocardia wallacei TaxID=480035 RepID=A0A7G1KRP9_9NOCA|nr:ECF RNA polymerase sigma factor SigK [Nocardia wallacei]BCK55894.1 ECF RNA polymerase sigma factor SigK [Nocardia wallacei]
MADEPRTFSVGGLGVRGSGPDACPTARPAVAEEAAARLAELLEGVAGGDRQAFTQLYRSTHHRVFGLALRILRRPALAEETAQEVYLHVWKGAAQYDARLASPIGWLMMLTHRRAVDRVRVETSSTTRDLAFGQRHLGRDHDIVAETVGQRSDERAVVACLETLTETQRETVALAYYGGRTYAEVADHLDVPLNTVKTRIRDGLRRLRNCLTGSVRDA